MGPARLAPPSRTMVWPVIQDESPESRNEATAPIVTVEAAKPERAKAPAKATNAKPRAKAKRDEVVSELYASAPNPIDLINFNAPIVNTLRASICNRSNGHAVSRERARSQLGIISSSGKASKWTRP